MKFFTLLTIIFAISVPTFAQEAGEPVYDDTATNDGGQFFTEGEPLADDLETDKEPLFKNVAAHWSAFPNLHPLVVHFPIVLLIVAMGFQFVALFRFRKTLSWTVLVLILLGFVGGAIAAFITHPQVADLPDDIKEVFEQHRHYAYTTLWLSGIAFIFKLGSIEARLKTWAEIIVFLVLFTTALAVSYTGYLGSQMVFIENVGPSGNHLLEEEQQQ